MSIVQWLASLMWCLPTFTVVSKAPAGITAAHLDGQRPLKTEPFILWINAMAMALTIVIVAPILGIRAFLLATVDLPLANLASAFLVIAFFLRAAWYYFRMKRYYDQALTARIKSILQKIESLRNSQGQSGKSAIEDEIAGFLDVVKADGGLNQFIDPEELFRRDKEHYIGDNMADLQKWLGRLQAAADQTEVLHIAQQLQPIFNSLPTATVADKDFDEDKDKPELARITFGAAVAKHRFYYWREIFPLLLVLAFLATITVIFITCGLLIS